MKDKDIKVKMFKCKCGKARMLSVIDPDGKPFSKEILKEQVSLLKAGCDVVTISLEEAKNIEMCFSCKL
jgi:hypothetical protein